MPSIYLKPSSKYFYKNLAIKYKSKANIAKDTILDNNIDEGDISTKYEDKLASSTTTIILLLLVS